MIAVTGKASSAWNKREYVARQLCRADGKSWDRLPNISTLWFRDKMHYRAMADRAISAARLWDVNNDYRSYISHLSSKGNKE